MIGSNQQPVGSANNWSQKLNIIQFSFLCVHFVDPLRRYVCVGQYANFFSSLSLSRTRLRNHFAIQTLFFFPIRIWAWCQRLKRIEPFLNSWLFFFCLYDWIGTSHSDDGHHSYKFDCFQKRKKQEIVFFSQYTHSQTHNQSIELPMDNHL